MSLKTPWKKQWRGTLFILILCVGFDNGSSAGRYVLERVHLCLGKRDILRVTVQVSD